jgi:H+/Cl- antiporter ClcA
LWIKVRDGENIHLQCILAYISFSANAINMGLGFVVYFFINLALATAGSLLAVYYEPTAAGSGIPEVKAYLNGTKIPHFFRMKTLWTKLVRFFHDHSKPKA